MPAVRRSVSYSRSPSRPPSTTPTESAHDPPSPSEDIGGEVPYARRRATEEQLKTLRDIFGAKPYPSREERNALAVDVGMDYKAITVWFQNKRQSEKRKAWTKNSRAKKRAIAREAALVASVPDTPTPRATMSLDHIASLSEKPSSPTRSRPVSSSSHPPLTLRRGVNSTLAPSTPSRLEIWQLMPSSPPEAPSSPAAESFRLSLMPERTKRRKSLEWACAKARADRKHHRGKENRAPKIRIPSKRPGGRRHHPENDNNSETETETEPDEAVTPSLSMSSIDINVRVTGVRERKGSAVDVEAAMLLLDFLHGQ